MALIFLCLSLLSILSTTVIGQCIDAINCDARGACIPLYSSTDNETWICKCDDGYTTFPAMTEDHNDESVYCNYRQKTQFTAFWLSVVFGAFGAGRFYCNLLLSASIKIGVIFGLGCCGTFCVTKGFQMVFGRSGGGGCVGFCALGFIVLVSFTGIFWWIADVILFGMNRINDDNGVSLAPW